MKTQVIKLLPDQNITYDALGIIDDEKIIRVFRDVWEGVPQDEREIIGNYWREGEAAGKQPALHLLRAPDLAWMCMTGSVLGVCDYQSRSIYLAVEVVTIMPDEALFYLIAHEMAHIPVWVRGDAKGQLVIADDSSNPIMLETEFLTDLTAQNWGADADAFAMWLEAEEQALSQINERVRKHLETLKAQRCAEGQRTRVIKP